MAVGLRNTAELNLKVTLDSKNINGTKKLLSDIGNALNAQKAVKSMEILENVVKDLQTELRKAKSEIKAMASAQEQAAKKIAAAEAKAANAVKRTSGARKQATGVARGAAAAEQQLAAIQKNVSAAMAVYITKLRQKYGAQQALALVQRHQNTLNAQEATAQRQLAAFIAATIIQKKNLAAATKANAAQQKAANAIVAASGKQAAAAAQQQALAAKKAADAQKAAAAQSKAWSVAQRVLDAAMRQGATFVLRNLAGINRLRSARNADTKQIVAYTRALAQSIVVEKQRNKALQSGMIMQQRLSPVQQLRENLSHYEAQMDALFRASFRLSIVGQTMRRFGESIIRFGSEVMGVFGEFEYTMIRAAGAMEIWNDKAINGAVNGFGILQEKLLGLAKNMKMFEANEVAEALYFWGSATGQVVNEVEDLDVALAGLDKIMKAAVMTNTDYETTIKGVYSILTQYYNGSLEMAGEVTEKLFMTTQKTAAEFTDLIQSFKMVGPVAAQVGASFDEVNQIFGKLSDLGLRGSMAGRGLRQFFIQMVRPSGPAQKAIDELWNSLPEDMFGGATFRETTFPEGEFVGITKHVENLARATMHLNDADRLQFLARISTANMLPLLTALVAEQRQEITGLTLANDKFADSDPAEYFRKNWEALSDTWKGATGALQRVIESLKITLGSIMAVALKPLLEMVGDLVESVESFIKLNPEMVKIVTTFLSFAAVGSIIGGMILIVTGALVGLGAALYLVWQSTNQWFGSISAGIGIFGVFMSAVIKNLDYIVIQGSVILDNLSRAFDALFKEVESGAITFSTLLEPAQNFFTLVIGLTGKLLELATGFAAWVAELGLLAPIIQAVVAGLSIFISAKMIGGIMMMSRGFKLVGTAINLLSLKGLTGMVTTLRLMRMEGLKSAASMNVLKTGIGGLVGGPLGIAALAITVGMLAYDLFPPFRDLVDGIAAAFTNMNSKIQESANVFGVMAPAVVATARAYADEVAGVEAAVAAEAALTTQREKDIATALELQKQMESFDYSAAYPQAAELRAQFPDLYGEWMTDAEVVFDDIRTRWDDIVNGNAASAKEAVESALNTALNTSSQMTLSDIEALKSDWGAYTQVMQEAGAETILTAEDFSRAAVWLEKYATNVSNLDVAGDFISQLGQDISAMMTPAEVNRMWEEIGDTLGISRAGFNSIMDKMGVSIGAVSTAADQTILDAFAKVSAIEDPTALARALAEPMTQLGGLAIAEVAKSPLYSEAVREAAGNLIVQQAQLAAEGVENANVAHSDVIQRLKNALEVVTIDMFEAAMPEASTFASNLELLAMDQNYGEIIASIMAEQFGEGSLVDAITAGTAGEVGAGVKALVEQLALMGVEGAQELANVWKTSGAEAGTDAKTNWVEGFTEGMSSELTAKELKKLAKMGTIQEQIARAFKNGKLRTAAFFKGGSKQSRQAYMAMAKGEAEAAISAIENAVNPAQQKKRANRFFGAIIPNIKNMPKQEQDMLIKKIVKLRKVNPQLIDGLVADAFPEGSKMRERITAAIWKTLKSGGGSDAGGGEDGGATYNPLSSIMTNMATQASADGEVDTSAAELGVSFIESMGQGLMDYLTGEGGTLLGANIVGELDDIIWNAEASGGRPVYEVGKFLAGQLALGINVGIGKQPIIDGVSTAIKGMMTQASNNSKSQVYTDGQNVGEAWAMGMAAGLAGAIGTINATFHKAAEAGEGGSPPKTGPLRHIDKWGINVGKAWAEGLTTGIRSEDSFRSLSSEMSNFTGKDIRLNNKKEVTVKLQVTSPDGSVNRQKRGEMRRGAMEALMVADLEHMVTVG